MNTRLVPSGERGLRPNREGGFIIVLSLLILFALTLLGLTSLISSNTEVRISQNQNLAGQALYAADAGINYALVEINNDATVQAAMANTANWTTGYIYPTTCNPNTFSTYAAGGTAGGKLPNGTAVGWYLKFKQDTEDTDHDGNSTELQKFTRDFGYPNSAYATQADGRPIIEIHATGKVTAGGGDISERNLLLEVGFNAYNVKVQGAVTSNSNANFTGNFGASGNAHNVNGALCSSSPTPACSCGDEKPSVFVDTGMVADISHKPGNFSGTPAATQVNDGSVTMPRSPWEALGIDASQAPSPTPPGSVTAPFSGVIWCAGSINIDSGNGILIVHNVHFDPDTWAASNPASAKYSPNVGDPNHASYLAIADSSQPGYDATYSPAKFGANSNGTIKGVIIADMVDKINGTNEIIGAVISLTEVEAGTFGNGTASINYSCDAINSMAQVGYSTKLVWRRL